MINMALSEIAAVVDCPAPDPDVTVEQIVTDSRKVSYGALFAALPGSQTDGHDFAEPAVQMGAAALLVSRRLEIDVPQLLVDDVLLALGRIAALLRRKLDPTVVGITGSNGKTTIKEMVYAILSQDAEVLATQGNYNNELGLPLSLFCLEPKHRFAVLEMGASKAGDIEYLARIAQPDVALVSNVGPAHLKGFGDERGVALAKGEIYASLPESGWAVMNTDEPWLPTWKALSTAGNCLTFGFDSASDIRVTGEAAAPRLQTPAGEMELSLSLPGKHNLMNAAAAAAAALALGTDLQQIRRGLESVEPVPGRLQKISNKAGWTVIDDTYNANPASLYSALQVLADMQGKSWLVLGDMKELGQSSRKMHREVGEAARAMGVARVFTTGEMAAETADAFGPGAEHFSQREELISALREALQPGVTCLVKGSRSMGMERVVEAIARETGMKEAC